MQVKLIIDEFLDYRSYVSHTLCQHRLFLGMSSPQSARERLRDAAVWPLVRDEAVRLCNHTNTLFGVVSEPLDAILGEILEVCSKMTSEHGRLNAGNNDAFDEFVGDARQFSDLLSRMYQALDAQTPGFSGKAVLSFLGGRSSGQCLAQAQTCVRSQLVPLMHGILSGSDKVAELYGRFWGVSSEAYFVTRCAIVAAAAAGLSPESVPEARQLQRMLRSVERVISCCSPNVPAENRAAEMEKSLQAESLGAKETLLQRLKTLGEAS